MSGESLRLCGALVASEGKGPSFLEASGQGVGWGCGQVSLVTRKDEHCKKRCVFFSFKSKF